MQWQLRVVLFLGYSTQAVHLEKDIRRSAEALLAEVSSFVARISICAIWVSSLLFLITDLIFICY